MKSEIAVLVLILIMFLALASYVYIPPEKPPVIVERGLAAFRSEQDFRSYLQEATQLSGYGYYGAISNLGTQARTMMVAEGADFGTALPAAAPDAKGGVEPSRVSETNVQVLGIDEPDIVKTDGKNIYFSSSGYSYRTWESYYSYGETKVVNAFPPENLNLSGEIENTGNLLLHENTLVIFNYDNIYGYDVSNPASPRESWKLELNGSVADARLYQGKIYLVTRDNINYYEPCPIVPLTRNGVPVVIECGRIYHPVSPVQVDVTYSAMVLNPQTGSVEKAVSFLGSSGSSIVYMSPNAIYVTYSYTGDFLEIFSNFFKEECSDIIPQGVIEKIDRVRGYDISTQSKMTELGIILAQYQNSLGSDERLRVENEMRNRMANYSEDHKREFMRTGIAKIGLNLEVLGSGSVPGTPLNQFSLDEYENHLRVAVTVGGSWMMPGKSANDVYVLDSGLNTVGSVLDMGLTERIYSVRFIQDKGYVVTFRQVDPFYVLDLSEPANPQLKGELKIPGYSSYLHPITKDKILGIGKEGSQVKISLFDVTSPESPVEKDKYTLSEYWSDILNTHHAFLLDDKHGIFFMPGSKGGYVFSYKNDKLSMVKAVADISARRAVYIEDYLYIVGDDKIVVLDENTWERVRELEFAPEKITPPVEILE